MHLALALLLLAAGAAATPTQTCYGFAPASYPPSAADLPLCGNGALDPGERCDDGNRVGGDGCNAWCSQFDLLTKPCTLAGQPAPCAAGAATVASTPALSQFCALSAVAAADGYIVLADGGALLRMDLFADATSLTRLPATTGGGYTRFCSVFVLPDGYTVLAHECAAQQVLLFTDNGTTPQTVAALGDVLAPATQGAAYYDAAAGELLVPGQPAADAGAAAGGLDLATCALLYAVQIPTGARRLVGSVPCVAYNVWEAGVVYASFIVEGMAPAAVLLERCMQQMSEVACYVLYMQRSDLQQMQAYIPQAGGLDLGFTVSTDPTVNVLGATSRAYGADAATAYTATGACFSAQSKFLSPAGKAPPPVTLGNICQLVASQSWGCATPLNTPFNTDVVSSPYLLPDGLTSRHTHAQLLTIFTAAAAANGTAAGSLALYQQVLANAYAATTPVAFAELPRTRDVVYITATTVGLISTKGVLLYDIYNPGYCRATDLIQCPAGQFGAVGGVCAPCLSPNNTGATVAAQVQCVGVGAAAGPNASAARRLLAASQSAPYASFDSVVSAATDKRHIDAAIAYYLLAKGLPCDAASELTAPQPFTMGADAAESGVQAQQLVQDLIRQAVAATAQPGLAMAGSNEYAVSWNLQATELLQGQQLQQTDAVDDARLAAQCGAGLLLDANLTTTAGLTAALLGCAALINRPLLTQWLPCAVPAIAAWWPAPAGARRRVLQADQNTPVIVQQHGVTLVSSTAIAYAAAPPPSQQRSGPAPAPAPAAASSSEIIAIGVAAGVAGLLLVLGILYLVYGGHAPPRHYTPLPTARSRDD